ncbi:MAG: BrxA/BrxB family bacilliredoxin [Gemmatimonadetes bacterium]|nr:BrxA/BrxB family bacilliredoxin [Gemmatimonadota bacterium]
MGRLRCGRGCPSCPSASQLLTYFARTGGSVVRYDPRLVQPMREELTRIGFEELRTPEQVDALLTGQRGTVLVVVNSVCGCAAGRARPGVTLALEQGVRPEHLATVFAGMDVEATQRARDYFAGYPPSSPSIALFNDGQLVHMMERRDIEGRDAEQIASVLRAAFDQHCARAA